MTCFDFEECLQTQLDLRVQHHPEELITHAMICGSCRSLLEQLQQIEAATMCWREVDPPVTLANAVVAAWKSVTTIEPETQKTRSAQPAIVPMKTDLISESNALSRKPNTSSWAASFAMIASAIAVCVMFAVGGQVSRNTQYAQQRAANGATVATTHSSSQEEPTAANERQLDVLLHDAREAYSALASQALQHASTANFLLPPAETTSPFRANDVTNGFPDSLSRPLSPWGHELRDAFDSLLDRIFTSQDSST